MEWHSRCYRRVGVPYVESDIMGRLGEPHLGTGRRELVRTEWIEALRVLGRFDRAGASFRRRADIACRAFASGS